MKRQTFIVLFFLMISISFGQQSDLEGLYPGHPITGFVEIPVGDLYLRDWPAPLQPDTVKWTFLFYDDAEFAGYDPLYDFASECRSTPNLNVLVLQDDESSEANLYQVTAAGNLQLLEDMGEINMGDGQTLLDFITYGKTCFPAERYFLAMYDHGGGWSGACIDETSGNDFLSMDEIQDVIVTSGSIDILAFTAPCLMGALECAYELRNCVDVYIGSEELSGYIHWRGAMDEISAVLDTSATLSNDEIGNIIIDLIKANSPPPYNEWLTLCAVNDSQLQLMADEFDELCDYMIANINDIAPTIELVRGDVWQFGMGGSFDVDEIDFYDFLETFLAEEDDQYVIDQIQVIMPLYNASIINGCYGSSETGANGLSLYFPPEEGGSVIAIYSSVDLDFADEKNWDEFLLAYYNWQQSGLEYSESICNLTITPNANPSVGVLDLLIGSQLSCEVILTVHDIYGHAVAASSRYIQTGDIIRYRSGVLPSGIYIVRAEDTSGNSARVRVVLLGQ